MLNTYVSFTSSHSSVLAKMQGRSIDRQTDRHDWVCGLWVWCWMVDTL